jgi:hypothetical protein
MILLKVLFLRARISSRLKPKIYDRATTLFVYLLLLGGVVFGEAGFQVLSWWS